jgi:hypothetical protein
MVTSGGKGGGKKTRSGGGGGATNPSGNGEISSFADAYDASKSTFNALGKETSYDGVAQDVGNSRIFGIRKELSTWDRQSPESQAGYVDTLLGQLRGVGSSTRGTSFTSRANADSRALWQRTSAEARSILARQYSGQTSHPNPVGREILGDLANRR